MLKSIKEALFYTLYSMTLKLYFSFLVLLFFFCFSSFSIAQAANPLDIVINEIAWMGTATSANDEWLELYNNTDDPINLDGWILKTDYETPQINLTGIIPARGFYLLERTNDDTVPEILADKIYTGALGNNGESLKLYDASGNVVDEVNCSAGWFAGKGKPEYKTMERINPLISGNETSNWQSSQNSGGTPKMINGPGAEGNIGKEQATSKASSGPPETTTPSFSGVVINEILPSPAGPDETGEWVEIFNQNNFEVDLVGWKIEDVSGKITTYTFPKETKISPQGFFSFAPHKNQNYFKQ